jgi:hypothetical protein
MIEEMGRGIKVVHRLAIHHSYESLIHPTTTIKKSAIRFHIKTSPYRKNLKKKK